MANQTMQVKRVIAQMKDAGFDRREFSAQVERHRRSYQGERYTEYGDAIVALEDPDTAAERIGDILAVGLGVTEYRSATGRRWIRINTQYGQEGVHTLWDFSLHGDGQHATRTVEFDDSKYTDGYLEGRN